MLPVRDRLRARAEALSMRHLEWGGVLLPLVFLGLYQYLMLGPLHDFFHAWQGFFVIWAALGVAVWLFSRLIFGRIRAMQDEIRELHAVTQAHNEQLVALHEATLALSSQTRVDHALQQVVELSTRLTASGPISIPTAITPPPLVQPIGYG